MKVVELIEKLQTLDPNIEVVTAQYCDQDRGYLES